MWLDVGLSVRSWQCNAHRQGQPMPKMCISYITELNKVPKCTRKVPKNATFGPNRLISKLKQWQCVVWCWSQCTMGLEQGSRGTKFSSNCFIIIYVSVDIHDPSSASKNKIVVFCWHPLVVCHCALSHCAAITSWSYAVVQAEKVGFSFAHFSGYRSLIFKRFSIPGR